jgi:CO/xanthine dehydrogenase FAD-binding subunit
MAAFRYHRPATLDEALEAAVRLGPGAAYLAGGTELLPDLHRGREAASDLIALDHIAGLCGVEEPDPRNGDVVRIGALTTVAELARSRSVAERVSALAEAARSLASPQVRSLATVGGNFCRAVPCADLPPAAMIASARVRLLSAAGMREIPASRFFIAPRVTALHPGEIMVALVIPAQPLATGTSFQRFTNRRGIAVAVASVAARVTLDGDHVADAAIALSAVAPVPALVSGAAELMRGQEPDEELIERAAAMAAEAAQPISDLRGSADYRRELVLVLARRALTQALSRARTARGAVA